MVLGHTSVRPTLYMKAWSSILELSKNYHMEFNFEPYVLNFFLNFGAKCEDHDNSTHLHGQNHLIIFLSISIKYLLLSLFLLEMLSSLLNGQKQHVNMFPSLCLETEQFTKYNHLKGISYIIG